MKNELKLDRINHSINKSQSPLGTFGTLDTFYYELL